MTIYSNILNELQLSENLKKLVLEPISNSVLEGRMPVSEYWYPHPPCLIPLFLGYGASYSTAVLHHFFSKRKNTFIDYYLESNFFSEIARNEDQLYTVFILEGIVNDEGISDDVISFSKNINYTEINKVDEFSIKHGDDLSHYKDLIYYNVNTPFKYINNADDYDGDFPSLLSVIDISKIGKACSFEISNKERLKNIEVPLWMKNDVDKKELFNDFISNNQLEEAWLTLNSQGWRLDQVAESLRILKKKHNDEFLHLIVDNWIYNWENSTFKQDSYIL